MTVSQLQSADLTAKAGGNYSCSTISRTITVTADPQPAAAEQPAA